MKYVLLSKSMSYLYDDEKTAKIWLVYPEDEIIGVEETDGVVELMETWRKLCLVKNKQCAPDDRSIDLMIPVWEGIIKRYRNLESERNAQSVEVDIVDIALVGDESVGINSVYLEWKLPIPLEMNRAEGRKLSNKIQAAFSEYYGNEFKVDIRFPRKEYPDGSEEDMRYQISA